MFKGSINRSLKGDNMKELLNMKYSRRANALVIMCMMTMVGMLGLLTVPDFVQAAGPTYVKGSINTNTTWDLNGSPYIVKDDITVQPDRILTIQPGVEVKFDGKYSIIVDGKLNALGTSASQIKFTSNQSSKQKGDWYTIRLRTEDNRIDWADIEYANYGVFLTYYGANNIVSNTTISNSESDGIYITNSDNNTIKDCSVTSSDRYGISIYSSHKTKIIDTQISYNTFFGINLNASLYTVIKNTNISYTAGKGIRFYAVSTGTVMKNITIYKNSNIGIDMSGSGYNSIWDSLILNNTGIGIDFGGITQQNNIYNTKIIGNGDTGIDIRGSSNFEIIGCNISENNGNGGIYSNSEVKNIQIKNSQFWNNYANGIDLFEAEWVNITYSKFTSNQGNGIYFVSNQIIQNNNVSFNSINSNMLNGIYFQVLPIKWSNYHCYIQFNDFIGNRIYSNSKKGIILNISSNYAGYNYYMIYNNFYFNEIYSNKDDGLYLETDSSWDSSFMEYNEFISNKVLNNKNGIFLNITVAGDNSNQRYNLIKNNTISGNGNGIYLYSSPYDYSFKEYNKIYSNYIKNNNIGINLYSNSNYHSFIQNNDIYSNIITNNVDGILFYARALSISYRSYLQKNEIYSNVISSNTGNGINFILVNPGTCSASNLYNNTIESNLNGIKFSNINNHFISKSTFWNNKQDGLLFDQSSYNYLRYNLISNSGGSGINLTSASSFNRIENNNITYNGWSGIYITGSSDRNLITRNDISINYGVGVNITTASSNKIHHNNFKWNTQNAYDNTIGQNNWDDGAEGNCWSDYAGTDDDSDGFGEDPYNIPGGGCRDWHPFMDYRNISAPRILSLVPENNAVDVPVNTKISIQFSNEMNTTETESAISISHGLTATNFVWSNGNKTVTFTPSSNLDSETTYTVTISSDAKDILGNWIERTTKFSFTTKDILPPKISLTSPFNGETKVKMNSDIVVTFTEEMQPSTIAYSSTPDPGGWSSSWNTGNTTVTFSHNDFKSKTTYTFQITAGKDMANLNLASGTVPNPWWFTTEDVEGPEIVKTTPSDGQQNYSRTGNVVVDFSETMDRSSVTYTCTPDPGGWGVSWSNSDKIATFTHNQFDQKTKYTFQITGAKDSSGNDLNPSTVPNPWTFRTTGDYTAPQISLTSPANNVVDVKTDANIIVTFSEAIDSSTLEYSCTPDPGGWSESWGAGNTILTLSHNPFNSSGSYTFQVTAAGDLSGNKLKAGTVSNPWSFSIADVLGPRIIMTSPKHGSAAVAQTSNVVVKFDEPIDTSSLSYTCNPNPGNWSVLWTAGDTLATFSHSPFESYTNYSFQITAAKDKSGNELAAGQLANPWWFVTIDSKGPMIISTSPQNKAINIDLDRKIIVTFNEQIDTDYFTFTFSPDPGGLSVSWSAKNSVATISHDPFAESTFYTLTVTSAKDLLGNSLENGTVPNPWTITTLDTSSPRILITEPGNLEKEVALNREIKVTFSKPMDTSSLAYTILPDPGERKISWNSQDTIASISHKPFALDTEYTFHITGGKDIKGNALSPGSVPNPFTFTTLSVDKLIVTPRVVTIVVNTALDLEAQAYDWLNNPISNLTYTWSVNNNLGSISSQGLQKVTFKASESIGNCLVNVTAYGKSVVVPVTIIPDKLDRIEVTPPSVVLVVTEKLNLSATGYDRYNNRISNIEFSWGVTEEIGILDPIKGTGTMFTAGKIPGTGSVMVSSEGITAEVPISVIPGPLASIYITPQKTIIDSKQKFHFSAEGFDKYENKLPISPFWAVTVGTITRTGVFQPLPNQSGSFTVFANQSGISGTALIQVIFDRDDDGIPDDIDKDDDGDGFLDTWEELLYSDPNNSSDTPLDTDGDGKPDGDRTNSEEWMDFDDDGDGYNDDEDDFPEDPKKYYKEPMEFKQDSSFMLILLPILILIFITIAVLYVFMSRSPKTRQRGYYDMPRGGRPRYPVDGNKRGDRGLKQDIPRRGIPSGDDQMLDSLKQNILNGENINELNISRDELERMVDNQFQKGLISGTTYNFIKFNILGSSEPSSNVNDNDVQEATKVKS